MKIHTASFLIVLFSIVGTVRAEASASFDCNKAQMPVEKAICGDSTLSDADAKLADAYKGALDASTTDKEKERIKTEQTRWLKERDLLCGFSPPHSPVKALGIGDVTECLSKAYDLRIWKFRFQKENLAPDISIQKHPFTPHLLKSDDNNVCGVFETAVQNDYFSATPGSSDTLLKSELQMSNGYWIPVTEGIHFFLVHISGQIYTVAISSWPSLWLEHSFLLYLKEGQPSDDEISAISAAENKSAQVFEQDRWTQVLSTEASDGPPPFNLFATSNNVYVMKDSLHEKQNPSIPENAVVLYQIQKNADQKQACLVEAAPSKKQPPEELDDFFSDLDAINVGGFVGGACSGKQGSIDWWQYQKQQDYQRYITLVRPWETLKLHPVRLEKPDDTETSCADSPPCSRSGTPDGHACPASKCKKRHGGDGSQAYMDGEVALTYINDWGLDSLFNYRIVRQLQEDIPEAKKSLKEFYQKEFNMNDPDATSAAESSIGKLLSASIQKGIIYDWNKTVEDALPQDDFVKKYRASLSANESIPPNFIRKAILLGMKDLVKDTPNEQISALNDAGEEETSDGPHYEPILFYGLEDPDMMRLLINKGADVNAVNWFGKTALMYAAQWGLSNDIGILLTSHADINAATPPVEEYECLGKPNITGRTALMYAAEGEEDNSGEIIRSLVKAGADTKATDSDEHSAKDYLEENDSIANKASIEGLLK